MSNAPSIRDFIAEKVGHRAWYTAPRRCPSYERRKSLTFIPQKQFAAIHDEYQRLFGVDPRSAIAA